MRLVTFEVPTPVGPLKRIGALRNESIIDLNMGYVAYLARVENHPRAYEAALGIVPPDMLHYLEGGERAKEAALRTLEFVSRGGVRGPQGEQVTYEMEQVRLLAPVPRPNSIRDFTCYELHALSITGPKHQDWYEMPVYYKGNPMSVIGPEEEILWPGFTDELDCEIELGLYIGKKGRNIRREEASQFIAGYTIFNDASCRDIPRGFPWLGPGKGKDTCNVMGPCLVTPDEIDPTSLKMVVRVNGEVWGEDNTRTMYWSWGELIEYASMDEYLYPGDFIGSGTPQYGCSLDHGHWLHPGDVIEMEIEGIGVLRNWIGKKPETMRSLRLRSKE